jgi:hypothetical protein
MTRPGYLLVVSRGTGGIETDEKNKEDFSVVDYNQLFSMRSVL